MSSINSKYNIEPFVGPRPFGRNLEDKKRFFGRDYESEQILSLITSYRTVLIFARSGAGKTSIINANIIPTLEEYGFQVLPVARWNNSMYNIDTEVFSNTDPSGQIDYYIFNILNILAPSLHPKFLINKSLTKFLIENFPICKNENGENIPQILVFDQLEEMFRIPENRKGQREDFFSQVAKSLNDISLLHIVFIIREDHIADLDPYREIFSDYDYLKPSFRLKQLGKDSATIASKEPLKNLSKENKIDEFENEIQQIIEDLLKIKVESPQGKIHEIEGEFIDPVVLQFALQRWWQTRQSGGFFNANFAFEDLYEDTIHNAVKLARIKEEEIRKWCENRLITSSGTRSIIHMDPISTGGINNNVIDILEKWHLIRREWRSGASWYELSNDGFIQAIKNSNERWRRKNKGLNKMKSIFK